MLYQYYHKRIKLFRIPYIISYKNLLAYKNPRKKTININSILRNLPSITGTLFISIIIFKNIIDIMTLIVNKENHEFLFSMMAAESRLSLSEKNHGVKILMTHLNFLKNENPTADDFIKNLNECIKINVKISQHLFTSFYPGLKFSVTTIKNNVNDSVDIHCCGDYADINLTIASLATNYFNRSPLLTKTKITVFDSEKYDKLKPIAYRKDTLEYKQTGQCNPDYLIEDKTNKWKRFMIVKEEQFHQIWVHTKLMAEGEIF